ncbi:MAG: methyltransferase regulatory domain-containing protein, partial [Dongiaceae bacterium]
YKDVTDPVLRETIKDFVINQQFRRDIFVRGAPRLDKRKMLDAMSQHRFVLSRARAQCSESMKVPAGSVKLSKGHFKLIDALADGPRSIRDLMSNPEIRAMGDVADVVRSIAVLVGVGHISPAVSQAAETAARKSSRGFNDVVLARMLKGDSLSNLASPVLGNTVSTDQMERFFLAALRHNRKDMDAYAWEIISKRGESLAKQGKTLKTPEENQAELKRMAEHFQKNRLPVFTQLGIV